MAFAPATEKLPPYYIFSADTGDIVAGPFERVERALIAIRRLAKQRGVRAWHKRTVLDDYGLPVRVVFPID